MEGFELANTVAKGINSFSFNPKEFARTMATEHRTLQQTFTRTCVEWLKVLAEMEHYDGRNEASVLFAKSIKEELDNALLPMI